MAQTLYARTASRGFPVFDVSGQSGTGSLPTSTSLPPVTGLPQPGQPYPVNDPANTPAQLAPPESYIAGPLLWGLPGTANPDTTPHGVEFWEHQIGDTGPGVQGVDGIPKPSGPDITAVGPYHEAPLIDPGLATFDPIESHVADRAMAYLEADAAHGAANPRPDLATGNFQGRMKQDHVGPVEGGDPSPLQEKVTGSVRANAGFDAEQGYGGGGKGPGGTNLPELTTETRDYPGTFYAADNFVNAAEVPHIDAETAQFIQNQPGQAPWTGDMWSFPLVQTHAQDITPADVPLQGPQIAGDNFTVQPMWGL